MSLYEEKTLTLPDGRIIGFSEGGDLEGQPVFYLHGFPGSRYEALFLDKACRRSGIRLIAPNRPGYGLSDFKPDRKLAEWPQDLSRLASYLDISSFGLIGVSGGAPYAIACAAALSDKVKSLVIISGLGEICGHSAANDMHGFMKFISCSAMRYPSMTRRIFSTIAAVTLGKFPFLITMVLAPRAPRVDLDTLHKKENRSVLLRSFATAFQQGTKGVTEDLIIYNSPWNVNFANIKAATSIWHGTLDVTVPVSFARENAERIPGSTVHIMEGEGHFSLLAARSEDIVEEFSILLTKTSQSVGA